MRSTRKVERFVIGTLGTIVCFMTAGLAAQWPNRPTPGVPRTPDGKADLSAPAPRSADGKPDLSGVWRVTRELLLYVTSDLKPEDIRPWAAALYKQSADNFRKDTDGINCLPPGPKAGISGLAPPDEDRSDTEARDGPLRIPDHFPPDFYRWPGAAGRSQPDLDGLLGWTLGGDTLVVTTAGYNDRTTLDLGGHPHTEALRMTERFHRRDAGHIDLQVTLEDPKAYTRPWTLPDRSRSDAGRGIDRVRL